MRSCLQKEPVCSLFPPQISVIVSFVLCLFSYNFFAGLIWLLFSVYFGSVVAKASSLILVLAQSGIVHLILSIESGTQSVNILHCVGHLTSFLVFQGFLLWKYIAFIEREENLESMKVMLPSPFVYSYDVSHLLAYIDYHLNLLKSSLPFFLPNIVFTS